MLNITKTVEYALIALKHMNRKDENALSSSREISENYHIPKELMAKTMQKLSKKGYIRSIKGSFGGYYLNISLRKINLIDFIESIEGPIGLVKCSIDEHCDLTDLCNIKTPIHKINDSIRNSLSNINLNEITR